MLPLLLALSTPAAADGLRFVVVGDTQTDGDDSAVNDEVLPQLIEDMNAHDPALGLFVGDLVGGASTVAGTAAQWEEFKATTAAFSGEVLAVPGNHDVYGGPGTFAAWRESFDHLPTDDSPPGEEGVSYIWDQGGVRIISVTSDQERANPYDVSAEGLAWLDRVLSERDGFPNVFVMTHLPVSFSEDRGLGTTGGDFWQTLVAYDVTALFAGHWHRYQPGQLGNGDDTWETIIGTGGGFIGYEPIREYQQRHGFFLVEVDGVEADATFYGDEGDPGLAPDPYSPPADALEGPTHSISIPTPYAPDFSEEQDDYRCFVLDPGLTADGYVTGFEVVPGDPEIVHHMILYLPTDDAALSEAYEYDDQSEELGYPCFGGPRVDASMLAAWAPSSWSHDYPEGTGIAVEAGTPIVMQMHYNDAGGAEPVDDTEILLRVEDDVDQELYSVFWTNGWLDIPPGEENWEESNSVQLSRWFGDFPGQLNLTAIGPHMHQIGQALRSTVTHEDGSETCLLDVPKWDFDWQFSYAYVEPEPIVATDTINLSCWYDSSDREETTTWGDGTSDEMCLTTMFFTYTP